MLQCERNTRTVERKVLRAARLAHLGKRLSADFEHGQWFITALDSGAQWSVNDLQTLDGEETFCFERVTQGDID